VELPARWSLLGDPEIMLFMITAPDVEKAAHFAASWFRKLYGKNGERFPDLFGRALVTVIDDGDWLEYTHALVRLFLQDSQRHPMHVMDVPGNPPMGFHMREINPDAMNDGNVSYMYQPLVATRPQEEKELKMKVSDEFNQQLFDIAKNIEVGKN
jgi:hypothetical protein